jgi:hypothetical protein
MTIFEPLFLLLVLATAVSLIAAASLTVSGRSAGARRLLVRVGIGAVVYFAVVIAVTVVSPRRIYRPGDAQCFDDWCITVVSGGWTGRTSDPSYLVSLRLWNRAKRAPMGEKGTVVYLTDDVGRRYDPVADSRDVRLDTVLQPGKSADATRRFSVPRDARGLGLVYTHEGGFPIGWLIIGEGGWFGKPPVVRFD